jgi:pimeloyl-ACP methyl ester carboxylesterase
MKLLAQNVTGITVPNSGHFIQEEQPDVVVKLLNNSLVVILLHLIGEI